MTTIHSGETDNRILSVIAGPMLVELHIDEEYMGFQIPDPLYLSSSEAKQLAEGLLRAAEQVPA